MKLSIILPCYKEAANLPAMLAALHKVLEEIATTRTLQAEIIAVDDGSPDDTYAVLCNLQQDYPALRVIRLARNFGKEAALTCGLHNATGDAVIMMDSDLQHPPEVIPEMLQKWHDGAEMVYALRHGREGDNFLRRFLTRGFYWLFHRIADLDLPRGAGDFRLMDKKVVAAINQLPERNRFMKGLMTWVGFQTDLLYFNAPPRTAGQSGWPISRLFRLAFDGITSFSTVPLRIWSFFGALISAGALLYMCVLAVRTLFLGIGLPGYASLMCSVLLMGGIQLLSLGIIGEYIGRIYNEVKGRPVYIIGQDRAAAQSLGQEEKI